MAREPQRIKKRERKNISAGVAHVNASFNNTMVTITDRSGAVVAWASCGSAGFTGSKKSTPFAAQVTAESAAKKAIELKNGTDALASGVSELLALRKKHGGGWAENLNKENAQDAAKANQLATTIRVGMRKLMGPAKALRPRADSGVPEPARPASVTANPSPPRRNRRWIAPRTAWR